MFQEFLSSRCLSHIKFLHTMAEDRKFDVVDDPVLMKTENIETY